MIRTPPAGTRRALLGATLGLALLLGGCASVYLVDNQVQSFARWNTGQLPTGAQRYRFKRLPSQREGNAATSQAALEDLARTALARVGWTLADDATPIAWTVQVQATATQLPRAPWEEPRYGFGPGWGIGINRFGGGWGGSLFMRMDMPYHERQVSILIRSASAGQVVYETSARHDGRWNSSPALWGAMLDAALRDFPQPPQGARQVNIELPR